MCAASKMNIPLAVVYVFLVLGLNYCNCGLVNLFNIWNDELNSLQNANTEKRETKQDFLQPETTDKMVSLMDIEKNGNVETEQMSTTKTKRCNNGGYLRSIRNPILTESLKKFNPLTLTKRASKKIEQECQECIDSYRCKVLKKCSQCFNKCSDPADVPFDGISPFRERVGLANRMKPLKNDDIFSKTMYPITTYREGETKNIICRIVGLSDITDIETVTIWVTTFSNNPPRIPGSIDAVADKDTDKNQENLSEQKLRQSDQKFGHLKNPPALETNPDLKPRFNDYDNADDDDDDFLTPKKSNAKEKPSAKENPSLIEGTLPFLRSSDGTDETVFKSPFLSESGAKDPLIGSPREIIVQPKEFVSDESDDSDEDTSITAKPTLMDRLKELRNKDTLKTIPETKSTSPSKGGFFQNLLKPNSRNTGSEAATPIEFSPVENRDSMTNAVPSNADAELNKKTSELTQALQEVKEMVENMKKDAQKDSENRLLGSPQMGGSEKSPLESLIPQNFVENAKKVNDYFIDRAQEALDTINPKIVDKNNNFNDMSHSEIVPNGITGLKKMSQHLLDNIKNNQLVGAKQPILMAERFGETTEEIPISTTYKNKLDQYLQERKKHVQKMYSPDTKLRASEDLKEKLKNSVDLKKPLKNAEILMTRMAEKAKSINNLKTKPRSWFNNNQENPEQLVGNTEDNGLESNDIDSNYFLPTPVPSDLHNAETQNKFIKYLENLRSKTTEKPVDTKKDLLKDKLKDYVNSLRNQNKEKPQLGTKKISELMRKASENQKENVNGLRKKLEKILADNKAARAAAGNPMEEPAVGKKSPVDAEKSQEPFVGAINPNMENRDNFKINSDWSNQLGRIVQSSAKPQDIFFMGSGVKLPLKVKQSNDGSMDLSVDLEKLCTCYNATCTNKNQTALDETVGAILEQEAVLEEQLKNPHEEAQLTRQKRMYEASNLLENHVQKQLEKSFKKSVNQLQNDVKKLNKKLVDSLNVALPAPEFGVFKYPTQDPLKVVNQLKENFANIFPEVAKIQEQVAEATGDVTKISEAYEKVKITNLENRLKKLDNEIEKLQDTNEKKVGEEARKFFQGDQKKRIQKEANILSQVFSWVDSLSKKQ